MKVIVLGAGVIGVSTAYYLARAGHEVVVLDRRPGVGQETSFANAGLVAPGHAYAWASPRAPMILLKSLFREDTALKFRPKPDPRLWTWSLRFLANCTAARNRANTVLKLGLCQYSQAQLAELREETGLRYDEVTRGAMYLYRDRDHLAAAERNMALLNDHGMALERIDVERCLAIEPALASVASKLAGAIYGATDESGDAYLFTRGLSELCLKHGVTFHFGTSVQSVSASGDTVREVLTDRGSFTGDAFVLALGSYSPFPVRRLGVKLPVYPIKGYSVTVPTEGCAGAPMVCGVDEGYLVAFARMGNRLRLTGTADFAGYDVSHEPRHFGTLLKVARELFPEGGRYDEPSYWACLRPMTPDGPPVMGLGRHRNLFFNTGHGHIGWTMACGSGKIVADLIAGRRPEIDIAGFAPGRY